MADARVDVFDVKQVIAGGLHRALESDGEVEELASAGEGWEAGIAVGGAIAKLIVFDGVDGETDFASEAMHEGMIGGLSAKPQAAFVMRDKELQRAPGRIIV